MPLEPQSKTTEIEREARIKVMTIYVEKCYKYFLKLAKSQDLNGTHAYLSIDPNLNDQIHSTEFQICLNAIELGESYLRAFENAIERVGKRLLAQVIG